MDETPRVKTLAEVERDHILETLEQLKGNRTKTSVALGLSIRTLRNKLQKYKEEGCNVVDGSLGPHMYKPTKDRLSNASITTLFCDYCHKTFERETSLVMQARRKGQTTFFCCPEHFQNYKYEKGKNP